MANWVVGHPLDPHVIEVNFHMFIFIIFVILIIILFVILFIIIIVIIIMVTHQVVYTLLDEDGDQNLSTKEFNPVIPHRLHEDDYFYHDYIHDDDFF